MSVNEKKPQGFFLYPERVRAACAMLSLADAGRLLLALCDYAETGALPTTPRKAFQACFALLQGDIDRDADRYREICERNRERINRRWHGDPSSASTTVYRGIPRYTYPTQPNATQPNATQPNATQPNTTQPNATQPNAAPPNPAPAAAAFAAPGMRSPSVTKGVSHDHAANPRQPASARGTVL